MVLQATLEKAKLEPTKIDDICVGEQHSHGASEQPAYQRCIKISLHTPRHAPPAPHHRRSRRPPNLGTLQVHDPIRLLVRRQPSRTPGSLPRRQRLLVHCVALVVRVAVRRRVVLGLRGLLERVRALARRRVGAGARGVCGLVVEALVGNLGCGALVEAGVQGGERTAHGQAGEVGQERRARSHDEDRTKCGRVRVPRGALQVGGQARDEGRRMSDPGDNLGSPVRASWRGDGLGRTSSRSSPKMRLCSSLLSTDWKSAAEMATPPTWPIPRKS